MAAHLVKMIRINRPLAHDDRTNLEQSRDQPAPHRQDQHRKPPHPLRSEVFITALSHAQISLRPTIQDVVRQRNPAIGASSTVTIIAPPLHSEKPSGAIDWIVQPMRDRPGSVADHVRKTAFWPYNRVGELTWRGVTHDR